MGKYQTPGVRLFVFINTSDCRGLTGCFIPIMIRFPIRTTISYRARICSSRGEFIRGKRKRRDVQEFSSVCPTAYQNYTRFVREDLPTWAYQHFKISDPKPRDIHKATVRDRLLHHAVYRMLHPFFHKRFIADSFSCQLEKGTHRAMNRFRSFAYQVSKNHTKTCWVLKCDIRKFFASIDHDILKTTLSRSVTNHNTLWLLGAIISSFNSGIAGKGLPLGNLTSQLFVNIHMNEFDQFVKPTESKILYPLCRRFRDFLKTRISDRSHPTHC